MAYGRSASLRPGPVRLGAALVTVTGLVLLGTGSGTAAAATAPPPQTVPAAGSATTVTWSGSIPGGSSASGSCPANALSDSTNVTINVPAGLYDATKTRADFSISWSDPLGVNDEILTVVPPAGGGATKSADEVNDTSNQHENVSYDNPAAGVWTVRACPFSSAPTSYTGKLVLTSTAIGGATGSPSPSPSASSTQGGPASNRTFDEPVIVDNADLNVAEPSIKVAADGAIYVTGPQGAGPRVPAAIPGTQDVPGTGGDIIWRSDDAGKTFRYLGSYDGALGGGDADVVAAPNGTLYGSGLNLACIAVATSVDRGESWATNPAACEDGAGYDDRQWNDVDGNAALYTGYGTLTRGLVIHKSLIQGPVVVNGPATVVNSGDYQWPGVVDVNPTNGNAVMAWNTSSNDVIQINGVTRAGALMFATPKTVATAGGDTFDSFVSIDHGTDGALYAVWTERRAALRETWTMLAASRDGGTTWTPPVQVDSTPRTTVFPWVTAGDAGRVAVTYLGTDSTGVSPETLDVKDAGWEVWSSFSGDYGQTFAEHRTTPVIHQGSVCTSGTGCATGTRDLADFIETDRDANGCLVTAYTDNSRDTVQPDGTRTGDEATRVAFVRQSGGDGLLAGKPCGAAVGPIVPEAPATVLLPLLAAGLVGAAVLRRRRTA
ncbi:MAG: hypothetical protein QOJ79_2695 [Actinomycetota bacterium]|jgi:hypothetical protein|nr:hypothetical protein [Actinomycetota bacterium]